MAFSSSDAAFEGFRVTREKPAAVALWALLFLLTEVAFAAAALLLIPDAIAAYFEFLRNPPEDPAAMQAFLPTLLQVAGVSLPIRTISSAVFMCALYRAVLKPQDKGFGYLRFGGDEIRQILLAIIIGLIMFVAMFGVTIVVILVSAGLGLLTSGLSPGAAAATGLLIAIGAMAAVIGVYAWLLVRLSLAGPASLARGRLTIREAWAMTKGHFWRLLGAYLLAAILAVVVSLLGVAIILAISLVVGGGFGVMNELGSTDFSSLDRLMSPMVIAMMICTAVLTALQMTILMAPSALAYRELNPDGTVDTFA